LTERDHPATAGIISSRSRAHAARRPVLHRLPE